MPVFVCRWQNGDFSSTSARSREEAVELLAEVGDAATCELFTTDNFMVHFHIKSDADDFEEMLPVNFAGFGEQTYRMLCERMYPAYCAAISEIDKDRPHADDVQTEKFAAARKLLDKAIRTGPDSIFVRHSRPSSLASAAEPTFAQPVSMDPK